MKKVYEAKKNFWIGEINKELKAGSKVDFDDEKNVLTFNGQTFEVKNLKAAIKAEWLVPEDGKYPDLGGGPVGETQIQEANRKRKERFAEMAADKGRNPEIVKDERVLGCVDEEKSPMSFANALGLDPNPTKKAKFIPTVVEDDTRVIKKLNLENKEVKDLKKALKQEPKDKKEIQKKFAVFTDHYDAEAVEIVGKYADGAKEQTLKDWETLHWTKKADVIKEASSKEFLNKLKSLESSEKIIERINNKILTLN